MMFCHLPKCLIQIVTGYVLPSKGVIVVIDGYTPHEAFPIFFRISSLCKFTDNGLSAEAQVLNVRKGPSVHEKLVDRYEISPLEDLQDEREYHLDLFVDGLTTCSAMY